MFAAYVVVTVTMIVATAGIAFADLAGARFVQVNSAEVGLSPSWIPLLGWLKAAGAVGLLLGILGLSLVGLAAAAGLVLFFIGAIAAHVRSRVFHNIAVPAAYLALAIGSFTLAAVQSPVL